MRFGCWGFPALFRVVVLGGGSSSVVPFCWGLRPSLGVVGDWVSYFLVLSVRELWGTVSLNLNHSGGCHERGRVAPG